MNEKIRKFKEANDIAITSIKNFLNILNLNPDAFSHLYNIKIEIGTLNKYNDEIALYIVEDNKIIIDEDFFEYANSLNIALSIVHETLHANRTIFINNGITLSKIDKLIDCILKKKTTKKHNISEYEDILNKKIKNEDKLQFSKYIPIKIKLNNDNTYNVIVHNKHTKNYEEFNNIIIKNSKNCTPQEIFRLIGLKLNDKNNNYISNNISLSEENNYKVLSANDYCHQVNEFDTINKLDISYDTEIINDQEGFEEVMVETVSNIIIMSRNKNEINLNNIYNKIVSSDSADIYVILGLEFIKASGINVLKWFMTSCYDDTYYNMFLQYVENDYQNLVQSFNNIYMCSIYQKPISQDDITNIEKINNKIYRKKSR